MYIVRTAATAPSGFLFLLAAIAFVLVCHTPPAVEGFMTGPRTTNETLVGTNMTLAFTPNVPDVFLQFKRLNGEILPGYNETFKWISLDEVDNSTGTAVRDGIPVVVQSLDLQDPSLVWTETVSHPLDSNNNVYKNVNFSTTFPNGVVITISYYYYMSDFLSVYSYINSSRTIPADSFKVSLTISGWQPISMNNLFLVRIDVFAAPYFSNVRFNLVNFTWTINTDLGSGGVLQTLNFLSESVVDDVATRISWYNEYVGLTLIPDIRVNGFKEYFYFPNWQNSLFYDPDFSALVQDQGTGSNGDGGSDDTTTIVIAVLVPTVVTGAIVFIIVAVIIGLIVSKRKLLSIHKRLKTVESLNNEITTEEA